MFILGTVPVPCVLPPVPLLIFISLKTVVVEVNCQSGFEVSDLSHRQGFAAYMAFIPTQRSIDWLYRNHQCSTTMESPGKIHGVFVAVTYLRKGVLSWR